MKYEKYGYIEAKEICIIQLYNLYLYIFIVIVCMML